VTKDNAADVPFCELVSLILMQFYANFVCR